MLEGVHDLDGLALLLTALRSIGASLHRDEVIERALRAAVELLDGDQATLRLDGASPHTLSWGRPGGAASVLARAQLRSDGEPRGELWVSGEGPAPDGSGTVLEALAAQLLVALDNAEQHARLRADEQRVWSILDNSNSTVFIKDLDGRYVLVNRQLELDTGMSRDAILGRRDEDLFDAETAARIVADDRQVLDSGELAEFEGVTQFPSGPRVFLTTKFPLRDDDGRIYALCGIAKDVSARRQAEDSHRLDALGQLAGGIAHDFNNMLAAMLGGAELICMELEDAGLAEAEATSHLREAAAMIIETGERAAELTRELLAFSREGHREAEDVDVHEVIRSMVTLLRRTIERRVEIELRLGARATLVRGDGVRLQAALLHLGVNARDAMAGAGRVLIATRDLHLDAGDRSVHTPKPGTYVEISVRDTGVGIEPEALARIFEPFYTTKEVGHGTGLGLVVVRSTVVEHGGTIEVRSQVGMGTEVILRLPSAVTAAVEQAIPSPVDVTPSSSMSLGGQRPKILLVDDEPTVRKTGGYLLESLGYEAVLAEDGQAGVERFAEHHEGLGLVLLDMIMPRLDGVGAFEAMREIDASVPIVICSGYAAGEAVETLEAQGLAGFLAKPYRRSQLADAIERALGSAS